MTATDFNRIEARRAAMKIPVSDLTQAAGLSERNYRRFRQGELQARPSTIARLNTALAGFKTSLGKASGDLATPAAFKLCVVTAAFYLNGDAHSALNADPRRKGIAADAGLEATRIRRLAYWISNQMFGFSQTAIAQAAGVTKQAVCIALREIEDLRDTDRNLDQVLNKIEKVFS
jgi:transcriptional regulator with XRE-family HTH domain